MPADLLWLAKAATVLAGLVAMAWVLGWLAMLLVRRALIDLWRRRRAHLPGLVLAAFLAVAACWGIAALYRGGFDLLVPGGGSRTLLWRDILSVLVPGLTAGLGLLRLASMLRHWRQMVPPAPSSGPPPNSATRRRASPRGGGSSSSATAPATART